jgi:hypothetical protein
MCKGVSADELISMIEFFLSEQAEQSLSRQPDNRQHQRELLRTAPDKRIGIQ